MALKVADTIETHSCGDLKLLVATFVTDDIDNDDTWQGPKAPIAYWWCGIGDNSYDVQVTSVTDGLYLFDSAGSMTGKFYVLCYDY